MCAAIAPTRTRKQTTQSSDRSLWKPEEDARLMQLARGCDTLSWSAIAKHFPDKTPAQIAGRWEKVLNPKLIKGSWTPEEDETILKFVQTHSDKEWSKLALILTGRTGKQCRERFRNHLDPSINRDPWTPEEDQMLIDLHAKFGNAWTTISAYIKGRSDNCIKNRWNSKVRKRVEGVQPRRPLPEQCASPVSVPPTPEIIPIVSHFTLKLPFGAREPNLGTLKQNRLALGQLLDTCEQ